MQVVYTTSYVDELLRASEHDPLELGSILASELPDINKERALPRLLGLTDDAIETARGVDFSDQPRIADAALRDFDFLAASLTRMGSIPKEVPGLEQTMSQLGIAAGTVPRGTVYSYALQNPSQQERTFTGTPEEHFFIKTVRDSGAIMLSQCAELLALNPSVDDAEHMAEALARTSDTMKFVVKGMVDVSRVVSPSFFSKEMRPFFDGIEVDGASYAGAGGAQLPLVVIDRIMWGSESESAVYQGYYEDNIRYQPADLRSDLSIAEDGAYQISLLGHLRDRQVAGENMNTAIDEARGVMGQIKRFRMPHRKVAQDNFKLRPGNSVGSGQYTPTVLDTLIDLTDKAMSEMTDMQSPERVSA